MTLQNSLKYLFVITVVVLTSCAKICVVPPVSVDMEEDIISIGKSEIPCKHVDSFVLASEYAIKAIYSPKFDSCLADHIANKIGEGPHADAWSGVDAVDIVQKMRKEIDGTYAETYGGIKGWWLHVFFGNIAFDGTEDGPIRLNRIPLKKRTSFNIANTIAHEVAHRVGLTHPHSNEDLTIANLEPPYVIGDMIERIAEELADFE